MQNPDGTEFKSGASTQGQVFQTMASLRRSFGINLFFLSHRTFGERLCALSWSLVLDVILAAVDSSAISGALGFMAMRNDIKTL